MASTVRVCDGESIRVVEFAADSESELYHTVAHLLKASSDIYGGEPYNNFFAYVREDEPKPYQGILYIHE